jgi:uncharacterized protein YcnI
MLRSLLVRASALAGTTALATAALTVGVTAPASAHVTANATGATQGGYAKVAFRVPNEKDDASTTAVEITLPTDTPIASVSLKPVPGWSATTEKVKLPAPIDAGHGGQLSEITGKIVWMADANAGIAPGQFQEFEVSLGPLPKAEQVVFKALQTYSNGEVVRWIEVPAAGQEEPANPAPVLKLAAATGDAHGATGSGTAAASAGAAPAADGEEETNWLGILGVALGVAGLVTGLLAYRRAALPAS